MGAGRYFGNLDDAITAYEQEQIDLHAYVWVRFDGEMESDQSDAEPLEVQEFEDGTVNKVYKFRKTREDADGNLISQYIRTTPGRIIYNKTIQDALVS
jgi:DNA-directed RNA polymerase subunit beta'